MDNGWLKFDQYRIPRTNMLSRFAEVDKEGSLEIKGDLRALYLTMVYSRVTILFNCFWSMMKSSLIATRYSACRRQFQSVKGSKKERKVIDYLAQ